MRPAGSDGSLSRASSTPGTYASREYASCRIVSNCPSPPNSTSWCATRPGSRTEWIGGRLHDALLAPEPGPSVLSTQQDNERALGLYARRGWRVIVPEIDFGVGYPPFCVLGKDRAAGREP